MAGGRRKRGLTDEERELWQKVAESIQPLVRMRRRRAVKAAIAAQVAAATVETPPHPPEPPMTMDELLAPPPEPAPIIAHRAHPVHPPKQKHSHKAQSPLSPIDARTKRKIAKGAVPLEERIDLHGMTQADAYPALRGFIAGARARGVKMVLVITGKGGRGGGPGGHDVFSPGERGVLRRLVPQWLSLPDMRDYVVGFEEAHVAHGGAGAIYVRLRAIRSPRSKAARGIPL